MSSLPALGLYVHIPFCERKCPYCDFNTYAGLQASFQSTVDALCAELARWRQPLAARTVATIFVGGGTPTVLTAAQLEQLFSAIHANFNVDAGAEVTCEANPGTVDREKFTVLRRLGVNRLSMGVQSFQPDELAFLGRIHDVQDVYLAYDAARQAGFANINLDFIFGLPQQQVAAWDDTLSKALALQPEHLSLYSLIVEPETALFHWVKSGKVAAPDDDEAATLFELAMARLAEDYSHYEVSNWSRRTAIDSGDNSDTQMPALACRHNLIYWQNADYLGVGPGAHSHLREALPTDDFEQPHHWNERRWGNRRPVAGEEDCLAALSSLPGLVALGVLSTSQANTIRGVYSTMLQHHRQNRARNERGGAVDDAMVDMLARHPELANMLEPILSAEQIATILARAEGGSRGTS